MGIELGQALSRREIRLNSIPFPSELLRINSHGIFVKGESSGDQGRVYEDLCAKRAREKYPDKFIISPQVLDRMALVPGSIFAGSRPDSLILEKLTFDDNSYTLLWGMEEYKSDLKKPKHQSYADYNLSQKAAAFNGLLEKIDSNPGEIDRCLRQVLNGTYDKLPINVERIFVPEQVNVNFITHKQANPIACEYPRFVIKYEVEKSPRPYIPQFIDNLVPQSVSVFNAH